MQLIKITNMKSIVFSLFIFGSLGPFSVEAASFDDFIKNNGTSAAIDRPPPPKHQLTTEQKSLVEQFRTQYSDLLTDDYLRCSSHISGLLEGNQWSLAPASKKLKRLLQWRSTNKIDELNKVEPDPEVLRFAPWRVTTKTRNGCPVLEVPGGRWLVAEFIQSKEFVRDGVKTFNRNVDQALERPRWATKNLAPKCEQAALVTDMKGFAMKNVAEANSLNAVIRLALNLNEKYFNLYESIIVVNAPPDFAVLLKTLQPTLGATSRAISVYSEKEVEKAREHVSSYIDPAELTDTDLGL